MRENYAPEMDANCFKLYKRDLIKVGRVRFKIRDIMSPVYRELEKFSNEEQKQFHNLFPSLNDSVISQSDLLDSQAD